MPLTSVLYILHLPQRTFIGPSELTPVKGNVLHEAQGSVLIWAFALIFMHSLSIHGKNQCLKNRGKGWGK